MSNLDKNTLATEARNIADILFGVELLTQDLPCVDQDGKRSRDFDAAFASVLAARMMLEGLADRIDGSSASKVLTFEK
jgi:hypothetical protein